jgi:esterase/lipase superfamily enzyme
MLRNPAWAGRRHAHSLIFAALAFVLTGCASTRPGPEVLAPVAAVPGAKTLPIYVATNRRRAAPAENVFTAERSDALNFAKFVVAVPPNHQPGNIEWPQGAADPRVSFATVDQAVLTDAEFRNAVAPPRQPSGKRRNVLIFVHGFNNNFQESLYRLAQIGADAGVAGTPILFAWPSQADVGEYDGDRNAAIASRDELIALLQMVTSSPQVGEIIVVAHSMGGFITAEALKELRIQHRDRVIARLVRVVLAAPDIDVDLFRSQVQTIGPLKPPLTVLVSKDDAALRFSSIAGGSRVRAGALDVDNPLVQEAAVKAKVRIIDISRLQSPDAGMNHDRFVSLAAFYPRLQDRPAAEAQQAGAFLFDTANARAIQVTNTAPAE